MAEFAARLIAWHRRHGRHDLPWQRPVTPYRAWISEIMLQQTQVRTVIPYFERFIARFPDVQALAAASQDEVLRLWSGLGYYARARNLHKAAQIICEAHGGELPVTLEEMMELPGIGRSSAGSILALSRNLPLPILDGNAKRVLCRHEGVRGWPGRREVEVKLWQLAERLVPREDAASYTQAIMDLGATVCTRGEPRCELCPVNATCAARRHGIQSELPEARPRRNIPVRRATLALIENRTGEILLERRPAAGVWGGLWSLPECPPGSDAADWVRQRFGWSVSAVEAAPEFRHTFTHFHLDIVPLRIRLGQDANGIADSAGIAWRRPGKKLDLGVAAPIRKLIENHASRHSGQVGKARGNDVIPGERT
ncbi:MAG TPA: A/G-specific adenine glycosylase [Gammaproteobacteria bacterium]